MNHHRKAPWLWFMTKKDTDAATGGKKLKAQMLGNTNVEGRPLGIMGPGQ